MANDPYDRKTTEALTHFSSVNVVFFIPQGNVEELDTSYSLAYTSAYKKAFSDLKASPPGLFLLWPQMAFSLGIVLPQD